MRPLQQSLQQQVRGKKRLAKDVDKRLKVRLLKDVPKYGRKGQSWYPFDTSPNTNVHYSAAQD
jgi:hypothetical protein